MVFMAMRVDGAEPVPNGVMLQVQPDLPIGALWPTAADPTRGWTKRRPDNSIIALQVA